MWPYVYLNQPVLTASTDYRKWDTESVLSAEQMKEPLMKFPDPMPPAQISFIDSDTFTFTAGADGALYIESDRTTEDGRFTRLAITLNDLEDIKLLKDWINGYVYE